MKTTLVSRYGKLAIYDNATDQNMAVVQSLESTCHRHDQNCLLICRHEKNLDNSPKVAKTKYLYIGPNQGAFMEKCKWSIKFSVRSKINID